MEQKGTYISKIITKTVNGALKSKTFEIDENEYEDIIQQTWIWLLKTKNINKFLEESYIAFVDKDEVDFKKNDDLKIKFRYLQLTILTGVQKAIAEVKQTLPQRYKKNEESGKYELQKNKEMFKFDMDEAGVTEDMGDMVDYNKNIMIESFYKDFTKIVTAAMLMSSEATYNDVKKYLKTQDPKDRNGRVKQFLIAITDLILSIETNKEGFNDEEAKELWEMICLRKNNEKMIKTKLFKQFEEIVRTSSNNRMSGKKTYNVNKE